jgi:hypothetical protein
MIGERGGTTATLEEGEALIHEHKASLALAIRNDILIHLDQYESWHRDNLTIEIPAESKNALGAVVSGLISSGLIEETGERRKSSDPAAHGRKSNVYRRRAGSDGRAITSKVHVGLTVTGGSAPVISGPVSDERTAGPTGVQGNTGSLVAVRELDSHGGGMSGPGSPSLVAACKPQEESDTAGGDTTSPAGSLPQQSLFDLSEAA